MQYKRGYFIDWCTLYNRLCIHGVTNSLLGRKTSSVLQRERDKQCAVQKRSFLAKSLNCTQYSRCLAHWSTLSLTLCALMGCMQRPWQISFSVQVLPIETLRVRSVGVDTNQTNFRVPSSAFCTNESTESPNLVVPRARGGYPDDRCTINSTLFVHEKYSAGQWA